MGNMAEHPEAIEKQLVLQFFGHRREGFFIEVGANDPHGGSQTWLLEQKGWRGILVEPQSAFYQRLLKERPHSRIYRAACGSPEKRGTATLHLPVHDGFSTLQPQVDSHGIEFSGTETVFTLTSFVERLELFRKMYLATPLRQWRLAMRRRQKQI